MRNPTLGDRLTPSLNVHHITTNNPPDYATTRIGKTVPLQKHHVKQRDQFRQSFQLLQDTDMTSLDATVSSWDGLQAAGIEVFEKRSAEIGSEHGINLQARILHAGIAGAGVIGAFLKVMPEAVDTSYNRQSIARQSIRTMMLWSRFSLEADSGLTTAVCNPKPNLKLSDEEVYVGLTFDPSYFAVVSQDSTSWLDVDYGKIEAQGKETVKTIDRRLQGSDVYFGCPFRQSIPRFYAAMTETAIRSGLL